MKKESLKKNIIFEYLIPFAIMKDLEKKINQLSISEKIVLVENIWDSIANNHFAELSEKEKKELTRRLALIKSGKAAFTTIEKIKETYKSLR